jgi:hypothetical protein
MAEGVQGIETQDRSGVEPARRDPVRSHPAHGVARKRPVWLSELRSDAQGGALCHGARYPSISPAYSLFPILHGRGLES